MTSDYNPPALLALQDRLAARLPAGELTPLCLPLVPEITLYLLRDIFSGRRLEPEVALTLMESPPYWSFCWASGQVMARWLLDNPAWVQGKTVLDVGSGSGVVAIAARLAGASRVIACDLDPEALLACQVNAGLNGVTLDYASDWRQVADVDCLLASDILYDRDNLPLVQEFGRVPAVLIADSRVRHFQEPGYRLEGRWQATTWPDLGESQEFNQVRLYRKS